MDKKVENIKNMLSNPKQRMMVIVISVLAIGTLLVGFFFASHSKNQEIQGSANVASVASSANVPGSASSPEYNKKVVEMNNQNAEDAVNKNKSFVPVIVGKEDKNLLSPLDLIEKQKREQQLRDEQDKMKKVEEEKLAEEKQKQDAADRVIALENQIKQMQEMKKVSYENNRNDMVSQNDADIIRVLMNSTVAKMPASEMNFAGSSQKGGSSSTPDAQSSASGSANGSATSVADKSLKSPPFAKAGKIFNAVLQTAVNSDEPSPVMAKIVSGELKGSVLLGAISVVGEKVVLKFDRINVPSVSSSLSISAVAIDPNENMRTALATDVDHHYLAKYGVLFGSAFLSGYGQAIQQQDMMTQMTPLGGAITQPISPLTTNQVMWEALGNVGSTVGSQLSQKALAIKTTIYVDSGTPIGILLMGDFSLNQ